MTISTWVEHWGFRVVAPCKSRVDHKMRKLTLNRALQETYVKVNNNSLITMFVFDLDDSSAEHKVRSLVYDEKTLPEPNWITVNPHTGHAHVGYYLEDPITTTEAGRVKPMFFGEAVYESLRRRMGADPHYSGQITRSPGSHPTVFLRKEAYQLKELMKGASLPKKGEEITSPRHGMGLGRNCDLFDHTRFWAYGEVAEAKKTLSFEDWRDYVEETAKSLAEKHFIENPLSLSEISSVSKSVAGWVWTKMDDGHVFAKKQSFRSRFHKTVPVAVEGISGNQRSLAAAEVRKRIIDLYAEGKMYSEIADILGMDKQKVKNQMAYARRLERQQKEKEASVIDPQKTEEEDPHNPENNVNSALSPDRINNMYLSYEDAYIKVLKVKGDPEGVCEICGNEDPVWGYDIDQEKNDPLVQYAEKTWDDYTGTVPYSLDVDMYKAYCFYCHWQNEQLASGYLHYLMSKKSNPRKGAFGQTIWDD